MSEFGRITRSDLLNIILAIVVIAAAITLISFRRSCVAEDLSTHWHDKALDDCRQSPERALCLSRLERNHEACASQNTRHPRRGKSTFDPAGYELCLKLGPEGALNFKKAQAREERVKRILGR